jgi:hypothetical protein
MEQASAQDETLRLDCMQTEEQSRHECEESGKGEAVHMRARVAVAMVCVQVQAQSMAEHEVARIGMSCWKKQEIQQQES